MRDDMEKEEAPSSFSVAAALDMHEQYKTYWNDNYREAQIDLKFSLGIGQWDDADVQKRRLAGKVSLVINELPQFIHQVTNDIRQNTPSIRVIPENDADEETAEVYSGLARSIEYKSAADSAYDTAADSAVRCGFGFIRIDHDYVDDESDEQELKIVSVPDALSVFLDPSSIEYDGRDADGAIILETITKAQFQKLYPGKKFVSFTDPKNKQQQDSIVIAEIFRREWTGKRGKKAVVQRYKFSGEEMLGQTIFPGDYIPIVPVYGEVVWVDGKRYVHSLIRQARDPQKRLNHWASKEAELLSMAPIAPVMAPEGVLVNERGQWQNPGSEMVLEYKLTDLDGNPANKPERLAPPPIPTGIINAMQGAKENIKESLGMYNASIGQKSNETSGVAIERRQREGDVATFHFPDNVRRSINQVGNVIVCSIPFIYDTARIIQIIDEETEPKMVAVNGAPRLDNQKREFDLRQGKYHVRVTTGASYTTKRQEAADFLTKMFKQAPDLMQIGGDLLFKNLDFPGAEALAARFKKTINPALLENQQDQAPDPEKQALMQKVQEMQALIQQGAQEVQQLEAQVQSKEGDIQLKAAELQIKQMEMQIKAADLQLKQQQMLAPQQDATEGEKLAFEQSIKEREQALKEAEFQLKVALAQKEAPDVLKSKDELQADLEQLLAQEQAEAEKEAMEQQQQQIRDAQAQAVLQALGAITQQLQVLTQQIAKPKQVVRDENGAVVGVQ